MPTYTTSASSLKYASSSTWTNGKARQGVYSSTRYQGAILFSGLSDLNYANIAISQIQMTLTFDSAGGSSTKNLTMYECPKSSISGTIASMRGNSIGALSVANAYNDTKTLTFSASTNSGLFTKLRSYFSSGGTILTLYVSSTRGTYSGGYCYDYLAVTSAKITFTYEYLQSDGRLSSTSIAAGSNAVMNITAYNSAYTHNVKWTFGSYSTTQSIVAGASSASFVIPYDWLRAIPSALSGAGTVTLETVDTSGISLGSYSYPFTVTVPASVVPTISSVTASPVNDNSVIAGWGLYVQGKSKANLSITGAAGSYGSTITSYSITTSPSIGSATSASLLTAIISQTSTITITGTSTDSRGRTATKTTTITVQPYAAPSFTAMDFYRCTNTGARNDTDGTYAYLKASFACASVSGRNAVTGRVAIQQVGGSYNTLSNISSGTGVVLGGGSLAVDATFKITFTLTDTVGSVSTFIGEISSAAYIIHVKKGGKAVGFGMAAGADNTVSFGWPIVVEDGASGAVVSDRAKTVQNLVYLGANPDFADTVANWSSRGFCCVWYTVATIASVTNKPSQYGFLINIPVTGSAETHQLFFAQNHGKAYHRGGNGSGWGGDWMQFVDTSSIIPISSGGTGQTTAAGIRNTLGLGNTTSALPIVNGGTGASGAKAALSNLGIFYSATLPASGIDGQICLVPV